MPRRAKSGTKGLHKCHNRGCARPARLTDCDCPWYGKYKGIYQGLAKWAGHAVDPQKKKPAEEVLTRFRAAIDNKTYRPEGEQYSVGSEQSFQAYVEEWKRHYAQEQDLHMPTIESRLTLLVKKFGRCTLKFLADSPTEIERFLNATQKARKWTNNTWNRYYELLHAMFEQALKWRTKGVPRMPVNPMVFIERKTGTKKKFDVRFEENVEDRLFAACETLDEPLQLRPKKLTWEAVGEIREAVARGDSQKSVAKRFSVSRPVVSQIVKGRIWNRENYRSTTRGDEMRLRLMGAFDLGLRKAEMQSVQIKDVAFRPIVVEVDGVRHEVFKITLRPAVTKGGKTTGELEYVYAGSERLKQALIRRRFELQHRPEAFVFGTKDGRRVKDFAKTWRKLFEAAGLDWGRQKGIVWHTTRHEFSSRAIEKTDGDLLTAQQMTRHKDLQTLQGYAHHRNQRVLAAAVKIGQREGEPAVRQGTNDSV